MWYSESLQIGRSGVPPSLEIRDFCFAKHCPNQLWWTRCLFQSVLWFITGVKLPGRGVYHTPQSSAEVRTDENYNSTPPLCPHCMLKDGFEQNRRNHDSISIKNHTDIGRLLSSCKKTGDLKGWCFVVCTERVWWFSLKFKRFGAL
jgi:hypothetical protein